MNRSLFMTGRLTAVKKPLRKAPLSWRVRNALRPSFLWGNIVTFLALLFSRLTGTLVMTSKLSIRAHINGEWRDYGVVSRRVITTAGVTFLASDFNASANHVALFNYHGSGTGTTAEAVGDTTLVAESTTILNPDSTRPTGPKSNPSGNVYQTVGTVVYDGAGGAITEHGLFSQAATGGGTLWDRSVFAAINVAAADSIVFTYALTITAGG